MINRRGVPREILSDNGTNFVAANRELCEIICKNPRVQSTTSNLGIKWTFNPPCTHFGGVFEIMIKAAKRAVTAILSKADVDAEELLTAYCGAEAIINSRPLTNQSANANDNIPLILNHFFLGQMVGQFALEAMDADCYNPKRQWHRVQELVRHFWHHWLKEWIPSLSPRQKWHKLKKDLKPSDCVSMITPNTPRGQWLLGRVLEVYGGKDNHIRSVKLQVGSGQ